MLLDIRWLTRVLRGRRHLDTRHLALEPARRVTPRVHAHAA